MKGRLPWQGLDGNDKEKSEKIVKVKTEKTVEKLTEGLPKEYFNYLNYCRNKLEFTDEPDYEALIHLFENLLSKRNTTNDKFYDWFSKKANKIINT